MSKSDAGHRAISHPLDQWGVPNNPRVGMVIGSDASGDRFNLITVGPDGTVGSAAFQNRDDAETAVKIINDTLDCPATGRVGGPFVVFRKGKFNQGIACFLHEVTVTRAEPHPA